jgi:hypothetical protein
MPRQPRLKITQQQVQKTRSDLTTTAKIADGNVTDAPDKSKNPLARFWSSRADVFWRKKN